MKIKTAISVFNQNKVLKNSEIRIRSHLFKEQVTLFDCSHSYAYPPLINSHDHLISSWYPKAASGKIYQNVNSWIDEMKESDSFKERNKVWINDGSFDLTEKDAQLIVQLGIYKNLFAGCHLVQDHIPNQKADYYENNAIDILKDYTQFHSLSMGNWWGGASAEDEYQRSRNEMPFIIHLGEGTDDIAKECFPKLKKSGLLKPNTLLIHGIALTKDQLKECAEAGTSICWCPNSNYYLIGKTLDIDSCLEYGVNVVLGTDSTMSGSVNLLEEIKFAHHNFPQIPMKQIFQMVTSNAAKVLMLPAEYGKLEETTSNFLLLKKKNDDPFENILETEIDDIELLISNGIPLYGDIKFLIDFNLNEDDYYFFGRDKFVLGHPEKILSEINRRLGYEKKFPFLPF